MKTLLCVLLSKANSISPKILMQRMLSMTPRYQLRVEYIEDAAMNQYYRVHASILPATFEPSAFLVGFEPASTAYAQEIVFHLPTIERKLGILQKYYDEHHKYVVPRLIRSSTIPRVTIACAYETTPLESEPPPAVRSCVFDVFVDAADVKFASSDDLIDLSVPLMTPNYKSLAAFSELMEKAVELHPIRIHRVEIPRRRSSLNIFTPEDMKL